MVLIEDNFTDSEDEDGVLVEKPRETVPGLEPVSQAGEEEGHGGGCGCHADTPPEIKRQQAALADRMLRKRKKDMDNEDSGFADGTAQILAADRVRRKSGCCAKIKWTQVFLLGVMFGPAVFPALLYAGETLSACAYGDTCPPVEFYNNHIAGPSPRNMGSSNLGESSRRRGRKEDEHGKHSKYRDRLRSFYMKHNLHEKATNENLDRILRKYKGREKALFKRLARKYEMGTSNEL